MVLKVRWNVLKRIMNLDDLAFLKSFFWGHIKARRGLVFFVEIQDFQPSGLKYRWQKSPNLSPS